jgi:hypothetical protein
MAGRSRTPIRLLAAGALVAALTVVFAGAAEADVSGSPGSGGLTATSLGADGSTTTVKATTSVDATHVNAGDPVTVHSVQTDDLTNVPPSPTPCVPYSNLTTTSHFDSFEVVQVPTIADSYFTPAPGVASVAVPTPGGTDLSVQSSDCHSYHGTDTLDYTIDTSNLTDGCYEVGILNQVTLLGNVINGTVAAFAVGSGNCLGTATLVIREVTSPAGSTQPFTFTGGVSGTLTDGEKLTTGVQGDTYFSVTQRQPTGWKVADISCDSASVGIDLATATITVNVPTGDVITCTFTNTPIPQGSLRVTATSLYSPLHIGYWVGGDDVRVTGDQPGMTQVVQTCLQAKWTAHYSATSSVGILWNGAPGPFPDTPEYAGWTLDRGVGSQTLTVTRCAPGTSIRLAMRPLVVAPVNGAVIDVSHTLSGTVTLTRNRSLSTTINKDVTAPPLYKPQLRLGTTGSRIDVY